VVVGVAQALTPLALWWLDTAPVYSLGLAVIAPIYIGLAVGADGRWKVTAVAMCPDFLFFRREREGMLSTSWSPIRRTRTTVRRRRTASPTSRSGTATNSGASSNQASQPLHLILADSHVSPQRRTFLSWSASRSRSRIVCSR
jgi:hypothetical protein